MDSCPPENVNWDEISDTELVRRFKSGNSDAFDAIVRRFQDRIYRLASVSLYDDQYAADVTQEVFVRSHKGLQRFRFRAEPFTWLYRTTKLVCHEFNRRRQTESLDHDIGDSSMLPERVVSDADRSRRVRKLVADLPDRQREVVLLRIFEDMSVKDTARAMGCREGTVKALLHKATINLEAAMHRTGFTNE